jgi:putative oxygen-independent coproporphyrinogen III oxidase
VVNVPEEVVLHSPPLGLYVHLPWCVRKCPYCDFNSHQVRDEVPVREYSAALLDDLEQDLPMVWGRTVSSAYFGGGTPSLFSAAQIDHLISAFRARLSFTPDAEITLEANPGTIERDSFSAYRDAGINRVSLGVQSFDNDSLKRIGRIHGREEVATSLDSLKRAGMENFNVDLMFGLPGQSHVQAIDDIKHAIESGAPHISHYQLTLEPNTAFAANPPVLPADDEAFDMQLEAAELLLSAGYRQYEISAWAKPGSESRHNLNYWRYGDFLGIGAGAHAKLSFAGEGVIRRLSKQRHPRQYLAGDRLAEDREIGGSERIFEYFLNQLRLREGITPAHFSSRTGLDWDEAKSGVEMAIESGWLEVKGQRIMHTEKGWRFVNDIQALFLP